VSRIARVRRLIGAVVVTGCGSGVMAAGGAGRGVAVADVRPDDRVWLAEMTTVQAIASSFERAYVVYPSAVGVWQSRERRWDPPLDAPAPDALRTVFTAIIAPLDQSLWVAAPDALWHLDPLSERWDRFRVPGRIRRLALSPATPIGVWVESTAGWYFQATIGEAERLPPPQVLRSAATLDDAFRAIPSLPSRAALIASGPGLRPGRLTAAAPDSATAGWLVGTDLRGVLYFAPGAFDGVPLRQGLGGDEVGALAADASWVWVATDRDAEHPAELTRVRADLGGSMVITGDPVFGLGLAAARELVPVGSALWVGSDQGVVRVDTADGSLRRWTVADGLTDPHVLALAPWRGGMAVGMSRGLVLIDQSGVVTRPVASVLDAVYDVAPLGDTLWLATDRGLRYWSVGDSVLRTVAAWPRAVVGAEQVVDVTARGDTLVAATSSRLIWREPETGAWRVDPDLTGVVGAVRYAAHDPAGIWLAGERGAVRVVPGSGPIDRLAVGVDLPAPVSALAVAGDYLWVGTPRGLLRVRVAR
jgi:ligand-binding sensor domain-containing protein